MNIPNEFNPLGITKNDGMPTKGLDFYCPFQNDVNDIVNGITGTRGSSFSINEDTDSNIGNYLLANAGTISATNSVKYQTASMFQYGTGDFTISYWLKTFQSANVRNVVLSDKNGVSGSGEVIYFAETYAGNDPRLGIAIIGNASGTNASIKTTEYFRSVYWNQWTLIRKNGVGYWYKNGVLDCSTALTGDISPSDALYIGYSKVWNSGTMAKFYLKSLRIYNRALTQNQIKQLANEFDVYYYLKANNQSFEFYPYPENQTKNINYTLVGMERPDAQFEVIEGNLPDGIRLNGNGTLTGKSVDTTQDITTQVKIRISKQGNFIPVDFTATIIQRKETILTVTSPQTFNFTTETYTNTAISCNTDGLVPTVTLSDNLPSGVYLNTPSSPADYVSIYSTGTQTSASSKTVTATFTTQYHPTQVTATFNINVALNQITTNATQTVKFYTEDGVQTYQVPYTSQKTITPVYTLSGTLPTGITFDSSTGTFTYDGTTTVADTATVTVVIASSTGSSATATATVTLNILVGAKPIQENLIFTAPLKTDFSVTGGSRNNTPSYWIITTTDNKECAKNNTSENPGLFYNLTNPITGSQKFTVNMWLYYIPYAYDNQGIFYIGRNSTGQVCGFEVLPDGSLGTAWGNWSYDVSPSLTTYGNQWSMFTVTYSEDQYLRIYINGQLVSTSTTALNLNIQYNSTGQYAAGNLAVGSRWGDGRPWRSSLTDVKIYNVGLTSTDVLSLYQSYQ